MPDIWEFVPTKEELKEQGCEGNYEEVQYDTYEDIALSLKSIGVEVDVEARRRKRAPWWFRNYKAGYVVIGQQRIPVKPISKYEVRAWYQDLIGLFGAYNVNKMTSPTEFQILRLVYKYAWELFKWFRAVREKAELTYGGPMTTAESLVLDILRPVDFDKTDWLQTISSTGAQDFVGTSSSPLTIGDQQGLAIFGHIDEVVLEGYESPIDSVLVKKDNVTYPSRGLNFAQSDGVADNRGVFLLIPNSTLYIQIHATATKDTKYHPVGVVLIPTSKSTSIASNRIKSS